MECKCQNCGFRVLNRRYPKCESCGVVLADGIALSPRERDEIFQEDRLASDAAWHAKQKKRQQTPHGNGDVTGVGDTPFLGSTYE